MKLAEERLRQTQKLEVVGQLTGGVAHDFNNLLGIIIGNPDFLEEGLKNDQDLHSMVKSATDAALRGAELTHHLLAFSRQQAPDAKGHRRERAPRLDGRVVAANRRRRGHDQVEFGFGSMADPDRCRAA